MLGHLAQRGKIVTLSSETRTISDPFLLQKPAQFPTCFYCGNPHILRPLFHPYLLCKKFPAIVTNIKSDFVFKNPHDFRPVFTAETRTFSDPFSTPFPPLLALQKVFCHRYEHQEPLQPHSLTPTLFPFPPYSPALPVLFIYGPTDFETTPTTQEPDGLPLSLPSTCQHFC